jgi:hypothetical protein
MLKWISTIYIDYKDIPFKPKLFRQKNVMEKWLSVQFFFWSKSWHPFFLLLLFNSFFHLSFIFTPDVDKKGLK